jgi:pimeloyl-ACP methyl ester carboxylesterase
MPAIEVNGTRLHYEQTGSGPPMVFIHGMCGDAEVWADQARRFSDRFTCVRYDRRGHSRSDLGEVAVSDRLHADDAAGLIEALALAPCLLVTSSGGAAIGLEVALRHRHLLTGMVLSEPPLFSIDAEAKRDLLEELVPRVEAALEAGGPAAFVDAFFTYVCPGLWSTIDEDRKDRYRANAEIGLTDLRSPSLEVTAADLAGVTTPALVLSGEVSHPSFRRIARALASALPDARFVELPGCGHVTYAEAPDAFAAAVSAFAGELAERRMGAAR